MELIILSLDSYVLRDNMDDNIIRKVISNLDNFRARSMKFHVVVFIG